MPQHRRRSFRGDEARCEIGPTEGTIRHVLRQIGTARSSRPAARATQPDTTAGRLAIPIDVEKAERIAGRSTVQQVRSTSARVHFQHLSKADRDATSAPTPGEVRIPGHGTRPFVASCSRRMPPTNEASVYPLLPWHHPQGELMVGHIDRCRLVRPAWCLCGRGPKSSHRQAAS